MGSAADRTRAQSSTVVSEVEEMEDTTAQVSHWLGELSAEFSGWRIGRGGSGHWWAVRGNELVRTLNVDELRARLRELSAPGSAANPAGTG